MIVPVLPSTTTSVNQGAAQNFAAVQLPAEMRACEWTCDITAIGVDAADSYDVSVQTTVDGVNFVDVVHFTQALGNGGVKRFHMKQVADLAEAGFEQAAVLAANAVRHQFGQLHRVRIAIVDASLNGTITFSVTARPLI